MIELSEEEKQQIMASEDFQKFFDRSTRVIERALSEKIDMFTDYAGGDDEQEEGWVKKQQKNMLINHDFIISYIYY